MHIVMTKLKLVASSLVALCVCCWALVASGYTRSIVLGSFGVMSILVNAFTQQPTWRTVCVAFATGQFVGAALLWPSRRKKL